MLSRVANSIYWMSRTLERAENVARFIDVNLNLMLDTEALDNNQWEPLVITSGDRTLFETHYGAPTKESVMRFLTFDRTNPNSILSCVFAARENARSIREIISSEMWEQANRFFLLVREAASNDIIFRNPHDFYTEVKMASHLFDGIADATLSHSEPWHFLRLGEMIERADKTSRILDVKYYFLLPTLQGVGSTIDGVQWAALLRSASSFEMYRKRHRRITPERVANFLILDRYFPRSITFCVARAEESLRAITGTPHNFFSNRAEQRLGQLSSSLNYSKIEEIMASGLHEFLDSIQIRLNRVDDAVYETFFALPRIDSEKNEGFPADQHQ
jgi:uncharacterized alpha-E superfamily protein